MSTSAVSPSMRTPSAASAVAGGQVVVDDDAMTRLAQGLGGVASDVAGATGDQNGGRLSGGQWSSR